MVNKFIFIKNVKISYIYKKNMDAWKMSNRLINCEWKYETSRTGIPMCRYVNKIRESSISKSDRFQYI